MILEKLNRRNPRGEYQPMQESAPAVIVEEMSDLLRYSWDQVLIGEIGAALETLAGEIETGAEAEQAAAGVMAEIDKKLRRARADLILETNRSKQVEIETPMKLLERALMDAKAVHRTEYNKQLERRQELDRLTQFRDQLKANTKPEAANLRAALKILENGAA